MGGITGFTSLFGVRGKAGRLHHVPAELKVFVFGQFGSCAREDFSTFFAVVTQYVDRRHRQQLGHVDGLTNHMNRKQLIIPIDYMH